ncbi:MAG: [FeFe] hydrogenase H-cluster maturation GTPase HydF [Peptococcales bacterium]|jgi:[FeFe] hydrogenase H-cluster maturation GTPase HydF
MKDTPSGSRIHIALFGRKNAGKSSLINALTNQKIALVSPIGGTTTDPVYKAMEILPIGPVMLIDTAGIDDDGQLGTMRVEKTLEVLDKTDIALLVVDPFQGFGYYEDKIIKLCTEKSITILIVFTKSDLVTKERKDKLKKIYEDKYNHPYFWVNSPTKEGIKVLTEKLGQSKQNEDLPLSIVGDLLMTGDLVILVTPIDSSAPKGRLILPQVQTIRDILDHHCLSIVCREQELTTALESLKEPPKLIVTDSQVFHKVAQDTPAHIPLTSFSILMARFKGDLKILAQGAKTIDNLKPNDKVLIAEACTHHQQADDIGKVKIPRLLQKKIGGELSIDFSNGFSFPSNLDEYKLVVHCGGCMLNRKNMLNRINAVEKVRVPITNYGVLIAHIHGILPRALAPFGI